MLRTYLQRLFGLIGFTLCATVAFSADNIVLVTGPSGLGANDIVSWSQLGVDGTLLSTAFNAKSAGGRAVTVTLAGPNSITSVVCVAGPPCSWSGSGAPFTAGDTLLWTSDAAGGRNGPVTVAFGGVWGAGAFIQADAPGQFTAQIQAFHGATSLGSFTETSDAAGDPLYIGVLDQSGANVTSVVFSLTSCSGYCFNTDFALDSINLNVGSTIAPTATFTANNSHSLTVTVGTTITYVWSSANAVSASSTFSVDGGAASPWALNTLGGSLPAVLGVGAAGHTYVLTYAVTNASGQTASDQVTLTVSPLPAPTATLTANGQHSLTVPVGTAINYSWSSNNGVSAFSTVSVDGHAPLPWSLNTLSGNLSATTVVGQAGHTYTLTYTVANASGQTASDQVTLTVSPLAAPTAAFTANSQHNLTVIAGTAINYVWSSNNAVSAASTVSVDGGAAVPWSLNTLSGNLTATLGAAAAGHTYVLTYTATNASGQTASDQVTLTVPPPAAPTATFTANGQHDLTVPVGTAINYVWSSANAVSAASTVSVDGGAAVPWSLNTLSGNITATLGAAAAGHTYVLTYTAMNASGQTTSDQVTLTVSFLPATATFTANGQHNLTVTAGTALSYAWSSTNAASAASTVSVDGGAAVPWSLNTLSGNITATLGSAAAGHTYVLTYAATNASGQTASDQVTLTVPLPIAPTATLTANGLHNLTLSVGTPITYAWSSANAVSASSNVAVDGGTATPWGLNTLSGSLPAAISFNQQGHTYVLTYTVTNASGQTASDHIALTVLGGNILHGQSFAVNGTLTISGITVNFEIQGVPNGNSYLVVIDDNLSAASLVGLELELNQSASNTGNATSFIGGATGVYSDARNPAQPKSLNIGTAALVLIFNGTDPGSIVTGTLSFSGTDVFSGASTTLLGTISGTLATGI